MAASAGTVTLDLDANSVKLLRELQKADRQTKRTAYSMRREMKRSFQAMGRAATTFGVALAAASKISIDFADKIGKTAKATGLTAEKFQELGFAAKRSGVDTALFNSSMVAFVKRVGEAGAGMGPLVSGLKNLNPQLLESIVNARDQAEALDILADGVQNARNATERAAITNAAFGRSGVVMVNMLRDGSDGLRDFGRKARDLGIVMSNELISNAEEAADKMEDFNQVLKVSIATQVTKNADSIIALTQALIDFVGIIGKATQGWNAWLAEMGIGLNSIEDIRRRGAKLTEEAAEIEDKLRNRKRGRQPLERRLAEIREEQMALQDLAISMQKAATAATDLNDAVVGGSDAPSGDDTKDSKGSKRTYGVDWLLATRELQENMEFINEELDRRAELEEEYQSLLNLSKSALDLHREELDRIHLLYAEGIIPSVEEYAAALQAANERFAESQGKAKDTADEMDQFATQAARNIQSQFADFLFNPFDEGLDGMLKGFVDVIGRMVAEAAAAQILKSLFGDGGTGDAAGGLASIFGSIFGGGKAVGGPVAAGVPYLVGERGPELIVPQSAGNVIPNNQLGGKTIVNNFNFKKDPRRKSLTAEAAEINRLQKRAESRNR